MTPYLAWDASALLIDGSISVVPESSSTVLWLLGMLGVAAFGGGAHFRRRGALEVTSSAD